MAEAKETVILDFKVDTKDAVVSIDNLTKANKALRDERKSLDLQSDAGKARAKEINAQLDKNTDTIKNNSSALEKQRLNVGNYTGALDKLVPGLGSTVNGFMGMTKAALAFIATPIGLVIGALGLAIGALTAYFKGSEEGQNRLNKIMLVASTIMEKVMDIVEDLGEGLFNAFTNPRKALVDLYEFIKGNLINRFTALGVIIEGITSLDWKKVANGVLQLGYGVEDVIGKSQKLFNSLTETFNQALTQGTKLADLQAKIDKDSRELTVARSKVELEVAKLRERAVREEGETKKKTVEQAIALLKKQVDAEVNLAKVKLEQASLELTANGANKEAKDKVAAAVVALNNAESERYQSTLRFAKEIESIDNAEAARKQKILDDQAKAWEAANSKKLSEMQKRLDAEFAAEDKANNEKIKADAKAADEHKKILDFKTTAEVGGLALVTKEKSIARVAGTALFKKDALKEIAINTKAAAIAAYKSLAGIPIVGPILGVIAAGLVSAYGAVQAANVAGIAFANGGRVPAYVGGGLSGTRITGSHGMPISQSNGDNLLATVRIGEVILNERQQAALGGPRTFASIGVPGFDGGGASYMDGSIVANAATRGVGSESTPNIEVNLGYKEFNEFAGKVRLKESITSA